MIETKFLDLEFKNPLVLASGILGVTAAGLAKAVRDGCAGVTMKSFSKEARPGHPNPVVLGTNHYLLNAVGLSNPGVSEAIAEIKKFKDLSSAPLIASIFAGSPEGFGEVTAMLASAPIDFLEVNVSCPNVTQEFGAPFAYSRAAVEKITQAVKARARAPVIVKLSPNAWNIGEMAQAAESAGADALTAVNTVSGMLIDVHSRRPVLANKQGGVSGPALLPIALKCVYEIYEKVKIPLIGTGGVTTGEDALAMVMAGATLVGVGSAVYYRGPDAFQKIVDEMEKIMKEEGIKSLEEIRGAAHQ